MATSDRQKWSYPDEDQDPWWVAYDSQVQQQDASTYALRETLNAVIMNGGTFTFSPAGNSLDWTSIIDVLAAPTGRLWQVPAGGVTLNEGEMVYITVPRSPVENVGVSVASGSVLPDVLRDDRIVLAIRRDNRCYFRNGAVLQAESSAEILQTGDSSTKAYERTGTFGVPVGSSTNEATYGRVLFDGSIIGISAELTRPVTAGTVTVNLKVNAAIVANIVLDLSDPEYKQATYSGGSLALLAADQVSAEVVTAGYGNADILDAGLTINVAFLAQGLVFNLATVANASASSRGVTALSIDPAVATSPIAYGSNDPIVARTDTLQVFTRAQGTATEVLAETPTVAVNAGLSNLFQLTLTANRIMGNPTNLQDGFTYKFRIIQDGTGGWGLTYDSAWKFPGGTVPDFSVAGPGDPAAVSIITATSDGTNLFCTFELDFS
jgi:hypothetical protein